MKVEAGADWHADLFVNSNAERTEFTFGGLTNQLPSTARVHIATMELFSVNDISKGLEFGDEGLRSVSVGLNGAITSMYTALADDIVPLNTPISAGTVEFNVIMHSENRRRSLLNVNTLNQFEGFEGSDGSENFESFDSRMGFNDKVDDVNILGRRSNHVCGKLVRGDVNDDCVFDGKDILILTRLVNIGNDTVLDALVSVADVDLDGVVNSGMFIMFIYIELYGQSHVHHVVCMCICV